MKVMLKASLTILVCNAVAAILIALDGFLTVRHAPWGQWAIDSSKMSAKELTMRYGDPAALLYRGLQIDLWVVGPGIALIIGVLAGLIYRRADWRVSSLCTAILIVTFTSSMFASAIMAAGTYLLLSWLSMNIVCSRAYREWFMRSKPTASPSL